jgi:hypothetical protein
MGISPKAFRLFMKVATIGANELLFEPSGVNDGANTKDQKHRGN